MSAWDGWLGSLLGTIVGALIAIGMTMKSSKSTRQADEEGQRTLLREQEAMARRTEASKEMAALSRSIAAIATPGFNPFNTLRVVRELQLAYMSIFRLSELLGPESHDFFMLMATAAKNAAQFAMRLKNPLWTLRLSFRNAVARFGTEIAINGMVWTEDSERRSMAFDRMATLARMTTSKSLLCEMGPDQEPSPARRLSRQQSAAS